jgi:hypothetical protein
MFSGKKLMALGEFNVDDGTLPGEELVLDIVATAGEFSTGNYDG